jgi:hypothetical protein
LFVEQCHSEEAADLHLSVLSFGILFNAAKAEGSSGLPESMLPSLVATISRVLEQDQRKLVSVHLNKVFVFSTPNCKKQLIASGIFSRSYSSV